MSLNSKYIYLDNHATTQIDPRVLDEMLPYLSSEFGNASSDNILGDNCRRAIGNARNQIATLINADSDEIFFTSGATEALNWALLGLANHEKATKKHIITSSIEHSAILKVCDFLSRKGFEVSRIKPMANGLINTNDIKNNIREDTLFVAIAHANNEIGTIQPIKMIGELCKSKGVFFIVDAAQTLGKLEIDAKANYISFLAASAHKIYGPKGIGVLYIRKDIRHFISPLLYGGGQEMGFRSGTENVACIVGFGNAARIAQDSMENENIKMLELRNLLLHKFNTNLQDVVVNGCLENRLSTNLNISFLGVPSEVLITNIENVIIAKGSACSSLRKDYSHVLQAITENSDIIRSAVRIGLGRFNTLEDVEKAGAIIINTVNNIRKTNLDF